MIFKEDGGFNYLETGEGKPIILLHGLMGSIENFGDMVKHISSSHKIYGLDLKLYTTPLLCLFWKDREPCFGIPIFP